jgi:hypothetical protein
MSLLEGAETLSIPIRLRRTTIEYGYVSVEVTPDLIGLDGKLDSEELFRRALEWGQEQQLACLMDLHLLEDGVQSTDFSRLRSDSKPCRLKSILRNAGARRL